MTIRRPVLSTEYVRVPIAARENGVEVNPTSDAVYLALTTGDEPASGDWHVGSWETDDSTYYARLLVGPSSLALAAGVWIVWVKVTDSPEIPVRKAGRLVLY